MTTHNQPQKLPSDNPFESVLEMEHAWSTKDIGSNSISVQP